MTALPHFRHLAPSRILHAQWFLALVFAPTACSSCFFVTSGPLLSLHPTVSVHLTANCGTLSSWFHLYPRTRYLEASVRKYPWWDISSVPSARTIAVLTGLLGRTENPHWVRTASPLATLEPGEMRVEEPGVRSGLSRVPCQVTWVVFFSTGPCVSVHPHLLLHSPSLPTTLPLCLHHAVNPWSDAFLPLSTHKKPAALSSKPHSGSTSSESVQLQGIWQ